MTLSFEKQSKVGVGVQHYFVGVAGLGLMVRIVIDGREQPGREGLFERVRIPDQRVALPNRPHQVAGRVDRAWKSLRILSLEDCR
jgi:hypothetical protein